MRTAVVLSKEPKRRKPWKVLWHGEPDADGRQPKYTKSFRHNREAREFQCAKQAELDAGGKRDRPRSVNLDRLINEFLAARVAALSYASKQGYDNTIVQLRSHFSGGRDIKAITQRAAEAFMASRARVDGRMQELSSWTKAQHLKYCRAIFHAACEWGYLTANPFVPKRTQGSCPLRVKGRSSPWHHLLPNEFSAMMGVVPTGRIEYRAAYWLMYGCGLRPGEAVNMTIENLDLDGRMIHVRSRPGTDIAPPFTVKGEQCSRQSKERSVSVPLAAIADLTEAAQRAFQAGGFLALNPARYAAVMERWLLCRDGKPWGGHDWRPWQNRDMINNMLRATKTYLHNANIKPSATFSLHGFRKSYAQNHADAGTPPRTLAELLGHSDTRVTTEFYNRVTDANRAAAGDRMDRILSMPKQGETRAKGVV